MSHNQPLPVQPLVYTVQEFCQAHRISRGQLYSLWRAGKGPRRFSVGSKVLIAANDASEWLRRSIEAAPDYAEASSEWRQHRPSFSYETT